MRKISPQLKQYYISFQRRKKKGEIQNANRRKKRRQGNRSDREKNEIKILRGDLIKSIYRKRKYRGEHKTIKVEGQFGLEENSEIDRFINYAYELVDLNSRRLVFDFHDCTRIWPSAITLLCSLKQWVELTARSGRPPKIASTISSSEKVNSYLTHSGFYDYVQRMKQTTENYYSEKEIVKIERETHVSNIERREEEIIDLLKRYSGLDPDGIEEFNDVVLTEIFNNVLEHGMPHRDKGWWLLAQYHKTHKLISLCVADNGIGIHNSLITGPQRHEISKRIDNSEHNEGAFIRLACEENISGALAASIKEGTLIKRYVSGSRRGNGLQRIIKTCKKLMIPLAILSHNGYLFLDENGREKLCSSKDRRIFAGTMYHLKIKAK